MLGKYGETLIIDCGLAKPAARSEATRTQEETTFRPSSGSGLAATVMGAAIGTPAYMSPEQAAGRLDLLGPASDIYGLGATLYALLTGQAPFSEREQPDILQKVQRGEFPPPRHVKASAPASLEAVCLKAMALRPEDRYSSVYALANDIEHWLADEPVSAYRERWPARLGRWMRRHRTLVKGIGVLLAATVLFLAVLAIFIEQGRRQSVAEQKRTEEARQQALAAKQRTRQALDEMSSQVVDTWLAQQKQLEPRHRAFLDKALGWYEEFATEASNSEEMRLGVADAHLRVGKIRHRLGQHAEAEAAYRRAQEYYEKLAEEHPAVPE